MLDSEGKRIFYDSSDYLEENADYQYRYQTQVELVPALPGCVTYGRTLKEAKEMAKDAISGYIASLRKHNDPIPSDDFVS